MVFVIGLSCFLAVFAGMINSLLGREDHIWDDIEEEEWEDPDATYMMDIELEGDDDDEEEDAPAA